MSPPENTVAMSFLPESVTLNFFVGLVINVSLLWFFCVCHVINPCVIPSKNSLKKLLSLIGIVCHMHEKGYHTMCFVIPIKFIGTQCAHTCLQFRQSWKMLCALFSKIPNSQTMSFCLIWLSSLVRASARQALSSILDMLGHPGHCFLSTSLLPLLRALYYVYTCFHDITHNPHTSSNCDEFPELQHITYKRHITLCLNIWPCWKWPCHF
jgi:hypothetical protein